VSTPALPGFCRYLAAKKSVDDRSLNRGVWESLDRALRARDASPLKVLEVGCGIGTMLERLLDGGMLRQAVYRGIDLQADNIREAAARLEQYAAAQGAAIGKSAGALRYQRSTQQVTVALETIDLVDFLAREGGRATWDLLLAHAFLDLVDLPATLPRLLSLLVRGGLFYFTLNFDGATIFQPAIDPDLDRQIEAIYHRTMDERHRHHEPAGASLTGRHLFGHLRGAGAHLLAAGSSDWVVFPGNSGYPNDEAYFLHFIVETVRQAVQGHPQLAPGRLRAWVLERHAQIDRGELIYIAHQLDFFGYI
jgi:SAM-dependent methyltransferase